MKRHYWVVEIVMVLCLSLPSMDLALEKVPGVTDKEVVIGMTVPMTGPAASWGVLGPGVEAWANYINDQGGIHGRKIKLLIMDDGYNPSRAVANVLEMKDKVFAICALTGTAVINACRDEIVNNKIPLCNGFGDLSVWKGLPPEKLRYCFICFPHYEDEADALTTYAVKKVGLKKIACFYQNDGYGKGGLAGVNKAMKRFSGKARLVSTVPYSVTDRALASHALKLKQTGAEGVVMYATMTHAALIFKEMLKIGYKPKIFGPFTIGTPVMYKLAGKEWEGAYTSSIGNTGMKGIDPEVDRVLKITTKYSKKIIGMENLSLLGTTSMMMAAEGLKRAGRNLTREGFVDALLTIRNWKPEGIGTPITFGPSRHHGTNSVRITQARKGTYVPVSDYMMYPPQF
jgi:branched-chain amino acid transport system substrate-binding protein